MPDGVPARAPDALASSGLRGCRHTAVRDTEPSAPVAARMRRRCAACSSPAAPASSARTSASRSPRAIPDWEVVALDNLNAPRLGAQPAAPARGGRRVRARRRARRATTCSASSELDAIVECSAEPSVMAGRRRLARLPRADEPRRRLPLPRARPPRRRAARVPLDRAASTPSRRSSALAYAETETRFELERRAGACPGLSEHGVAEALPARRRAHALRRDQARRRAADRRVRRDATGCARWSTAAA